MLGIKLKDWAGLFGLAILQSNTLPFVFSAIDGAMPPTILPAYMLVVGLSLYLIRSLADKDMLYTAGNTIGIVSNLILIFLFHTS